MDLKKTHIKLLAVNSNLKKYRIYIDRGRSILRGWYFLLWCSLFIPGSDIVNIYWVTTVYQEWCQILYMDYHLILVTALGSTISSFCGWEFKALQSRTQWVFFFIALNMVGNYISILFVSEGRDPVSVSTLAYSVLSVEPGTQEGGTGNQCWTN